MLDAAASPLPPAVSRAARRTLLNVLGTAASAAGSPAVTVLLAAAAEQGSAGDVRVPGLAGTLDPYWGALVTGTAAHLDDFDDTHLATVIHPGAATLATVLSLAPETAPSGAAFLGAFAAGCEAQLQIGNAISPAHYDHGWHITGTCGVFGAAVAASALLGLDAEAASRALSLAATMTLGHREAFGSMTKPLHAGKAAANGVLAARLAAAGLSAPPDPLGPGGVLEVLAAAVDRDALSRGWELELNTFKTYPCGVVAHPAMDGAIAVSDRIDPAEITAITLRCHPLVPELMGTLHPADGLRSRFSARHGVAAGLLFGRAGLPEFSDAVATEPEVARLRALITLDPDPEMARDAAILRIETRSAEPVEVRVEHTRGSIARPLTDDELQDKVQVLVTPILGDGAADRIRKAVDNLPAASDASVLLAALRPSTPAPRQDSGAPRPGATRHVTGPETTTDRLLALAARPTPTPEAVTAVSRFTAAVTTQRGIDTARTLLGILRPMADDAAAPAQAGGPALTAWVTGAGAVAGLGPGALAGSENRDLPSDMAPDDPDPVVAMVVCAAARALGDDCLAAVAAGLAAAVVVESGLDDVASPGWSVPIVTAGVGAGLAAGVMLGLPEDQLRNALGVCATQAAGLSAAAGTDAGPLQAGKAAFNAVEAALLARVGFTSSAEPLDGRRGLFALFRQG
jgi:2-methylcitrate dehydratase PrpD